MLHFFQSNNEALQGLVALTSVILLVPSAILFIVNQEAQRHLAREENHKYLIEQYRNFLQLCLSYAKLSLEGGVPRMDVSEEERLQRDILFDILTSIFERAFLTYRDSWRSHRKRQWKGWDDYIGLYAARPDYLEWWRRSVFKDNAARYFVLGASQYDERFERFMFDKIRPVFTQFESDGTLDRFAPSKELTEKNTESRRLTPAGAEG
jgi:hypothetical protein